MAQILIVLLVLTLAVYLVILLVGAVVFVLIFLLQALWWLGVMAVITLPAGGLAYGLMAAVENYYCRSRVKKLHREGKLQDMLQVYFKESIINWQFDAEALAQFDNGGLLKVLLFTCGLTSIWGGLFALDALGALKVEVGTSLVGNDLAQAQQINVWLAYGFASATVGAALVFLPRSFRHVMVTQAGVHLSRNKGRLEGASRGHQAAMQRYEAAADLVIGTGDVALVKALDTCHKGLHSPNLADFLKREEWDKFDVHLAGIAADLQTLHEIAQNYFATGEDREETTSSGQDLPLNRSQALKALGFGPNANPTRDEIKKAFRRLSKLYNLDQRQELVGAEREQLEELWKNLNEAYSLLSP